MKKIKYIAYYSDPDSSKNRCTAPSADTKLDYIIEALKADECDVSVISRCLVGKYDEIFKIHRGYMTEKFGVQIRFLNDYTSKCRVVRFLRTWLANYQLRKLVKSECVKNGCKIIIYHSLGMYDIIKYLKKHKISYILEVEEIYSDVMTKRRIQNRKKEDFMFSAAESYIFSTELLNKEINTQNKPYLVCNGTYKVEESLIEEKIFEDKEKIHCVYAGTLDPRKGGAAAAAAGEFLSDKYHMHILGFGSEEEVQNMKELTEEVNNKSEATVTYDGLLKGDDYLQFIQSCDIGLSTQDPNADFNATSFPSKILSYMSNGLRVVSIRIPAIETSKVGDYLYFYNSQEPQQIAEAIMKIDINCGQDCKEKISQLNDKFINALKVFLEEE